MPGPVELIPVHEYHQRSKHRLTAYAAGPEVLDWDDQPEAFRWFEGASRIDLPLLADEVEAAFVDVYRPERALSERSAFACLAILLERALGLAAWKSYGDSRWALRCNPSSGNLHPTELYVITAGLTGLVAGVYHYLSRDHQLEQRCQLDPRRMASCLPGGSLLVALSSVHWREAWKYGERAYRYCQHDCGHAIAALAYAAAPLGYSLRLLDTWGDEDIAAVAGLDRAQDFAGAEREHPDVMLLLEPGTGGVVNPDVAALAAQAVEAVWYGQANCLSVRHSHHWPVVDEIAAACRKPVTAALSAEILPHRPQPLSSDCTERAMTLFLRRRSAQQFDGRTSITGRMLYRMLDMTLPRPDVVPWSALPLETRIHLVLFVHRVEGLKPGLYLFCRDPGKLDRLRAGLIRPEFQWRKVPDCPLRPPLYSLVSANCRNAAATLSCHQSIAGDSAFSVVMLAEFDAVLEAGNWMYRQLYWEAGMLGQVFYLEAEAAGVSGTGIGCFFDDAVHETLGIKDTRLQSLYHFTVGGALVDERLTTWPPYYHLDRG